MKRAHIENALIKNSMLLRDVEADIAELEQKRQELLKYRHKLRVKSINAGYYFGGTIIRGVD
jgi:hypothetical protein